MFDKSGVRCWEPAAHVSLLICQVQLLCVCGSTEIEPLQGTSGCEYMDRRLGNTDIRTVFVPRKMVSLISEHILEEILLQRFPRPKTAPAQIRLLLAYNHKFKVRQQYIA
eukprot:SAG31_NODE_10171_length_1175_cov_1.207221_2_plen_110_part_00